MKVQALQSFEHGGSRRRHDEFEVSDATGQALAQKGLVRIIDRAADAQPPAPKPSRRTKRVSEDQE